MSSTSKRLKATSFAVSEVIPAVARSRPIWSRQAPVNWMLIVIVKRSLRSSLYRFGRIFERGKTDMYAVSTRVFKHKCHVVLFEVLRNHKKQAQQFADISPYAN
uniref:Uncharacterized protein n=1 Tax=Glossina austeni TaxID=7395 RepID=A0A1A9UYV1_GLOAU